MYAAYQVISLCICDVRFFVFFFVKGRVGWGGGDLRMDTLHLNIRLVEVLIQITVNNIVDILCSS